MIKSLLAAASVALLTAATLMLSAPGADAQRRMGGMGGMGGQGGMSGGGGMGGGCPRGYDGCFNHCLEMGGAGSRTPAAGCAHRCGSRCTAGGAQSGPHEPGKGHH
jgi:hypothetical protein